MRALFFILALAASAHAAVVADALLDFEGVPRGLLVSNTLQAGVHGTNYLSLGPFRGTNMTEFERHNAVEFITTSQFTVTVNGTNYTGTGTNGLEVVMNTEGALPKSSLQWRFGTPSLNSYPVGAALMFGHVKYSIWTNNTVNLDTFLQNNSGDQWTVMQSHGGAPGHISAHSADGNLGRISITTNKLYFFEAIRDSTNALLTIRYRDPADGYARVGTNIFITFPEPTKGLWEIEFQGGYLFEPSGSVYWDNVGVVFGRTNFLTEAEMGIPTQASALTGRINLSGQSVIQ